MEAKTSKKQNPSEFLRQIIGKPVVVKLNSGVDYRGVLACLDGYMNIALEQTEEYVNGQVGNSLLCIFFSHGTGFELFLKLIFFKLKNKYGDTFIRGNNVLYISTTRSRGR